VVEHIIRSQQRIDVSASFTAITNATELDAFIDLLSPTAISSIQVTLDGPKGLHDRRRIYANGSGSFEKILEHIQLALDSNVKVSVRVNVDRHNVEFLPDLANVLNSRGFDSYQNFSAYLAPINDYTGLKNAGTREDFFNSWELGLALRALHDSNRETRIFSRVDGGIRDRVMGIFRSGERDSQKTAFCGAHTGMYIFDSFGNIFACWDRTGDERLRIGTVGEDSKITINGMGDLWRSRNVASNDICKQCRYALHCGGGCAALAEVTSGTIMSNFCNAYGKRFRAAVAEAYEAHSASSTGAYAGSS